MRNLDANRMVKLLLDGYGRTFAEELGIRVEANTPSELFCLLIATLLSSARIGHGIALKSAGLLFRRGWRTAQRMSTTSWEERVKALDEGGYVRYDERTSTMLGQTAQMVLELYRGDLRNLRRAANADPAQERKLLKEFKGIGEVGVDIFFREAQLAWPELFPFADKRTLATARTLHLPTGVSQLKSLIRGRHEFVRLIAALVRVGLERKEKQIQAQARAA